MDFLALSQRLALEAGVSGTLATTSGQTGSLARVVTWVGQAWLELQSARDDWQWMRSSNLLGAGASFVTVAGQASYPLGSGPGTCGVPVASFGKWVRGSFRGYTTATGTLDEISLDDIGFDVWRDVYMMGANRVVQTRPVVIAVGSDKSLCLGPPPNGLYTVTGDYFTAPVAMAIDSDVPVGLPAQFHMAIVYKAMMAYGGYEAASEVFQRGAAGYNSLKAELEALRLPEMHWAGALA